MANKLTSAGGFIYAEPSETDGWMYGCEFHDLDGNRWHFLCMDMNKIPKH